VGQCSSIIVIALPHPAEMFVETVIGELNGSLVPASPPPGLVSGYEQDRTPLGIEREQDPYFGSTR
jgi:hypothetical protein